MTDVLATPRTSGTTGVDEAAEARTWRLTVVTTTLIAFVAYALTSLARYARGDGGWDLAIFDQAVRHYSRLEAPVAAARGPHVNLLGDHFSPIWAVVAPLYRIWDDPRLLLVVQAALVAVSVPVVARMVRRHHPRGLAVALTAAYAVGWPLQRLLTFDVHEVAFAVPLLALAVDALDRRDDRVLVLALLPLLAVREDMGLVLATFGVLRLLLHGRRRRWPGAALVVVGGTAYVAVTAYAIPAFAPSGSWIYWTYEQLGPDLPSSLANVAEHPLHAVALLFTPSAKAVTLGSLFLPLLLLPLRSPYVLVAVPLLAERFWSSRETLWSVHFHYSAVVWPILFLAAVDGARRFGPSLGRRLSAALAVTGLTLPALGLLVGGPYTVTLAAGPWTWHTAQGDAAQRVLARISSDSCVEADEQLTPYLSSRTLVSVPGQLGRQPDFVAVDLTRGAGLSSPAGAVSRARALADGYVEVYRTGTLVLLRSPSYDGPTAACAP